MARRRRRSSSLITLTPAPPKAWLQGGWSQALPLRRGVGGHAERRPLRRHVPHSREARGELKLAPTDPAHCPRTGGICRLVISMTMRLVLEREIEVGFHQGPLQRKGGQ